MKKISSVILAIIICTSCAKNNKAAGSYCYRCHIVGGIPSTTRDLDTCANTTSDHFEFKDASGNVQSFYCNEK